MQGEPRFAAGLYYIHDSGVRRQATGSFRKSESTLPDLKATHDDYPNTRYTSLTYKTQTADQLKEDPDFKIIYVIVVKNKDTIAQPEEAALKDEIGGAFGDKGAMAKEYDPAFASAQVHNPNAKGTDKVPLTSLSTLKDLTATLAYYQDLNTKALKMKIAELEKQINKGAATTPEQICNQVGVNKTKCVETEGCYFADTNEKGKQCTLTQEAAAKSEKAEERQQGKGGKTDSNCTNKGNRKHPAKPRIVCSTVKIAKIPVFSSIRHLL
uniref:Variant surface glycoprotein n=1 Tax=Trypanosoma brucei TaxID=5691 RepID=A0A1V0FYF9_9TRYP|nr:variant surface glycoprotein [Trypanosoma brucei]